MNKFLSVFMCFFLLLSTAGCLPITHDQPQITIEEQKVLYDNIISQYTSLLAAKHQGGIITAPITDGKSQQEIVIDEALYNIVNDLNNTQTIENMGYGYKDLDGNGILELILLTGGTNIKAIFTISDNIPILLEANYGIGNSLFFATKKRLFMTRRSVNDNLEETLYYTSRVAGDKMEYDAIYGKIYDQSKKEILEMFQVSNEKRITISNDDFNELYREHKKTTQMDYRTTSKLLSPRIYFPLKDIVINENLPVADFSSYTAIRNTYNKIATCLDTFQLSKWYEGEYDSLFAFPDDLSFEYYTRLLYSAYYKNYCIGYDEIDINSDGQCELVLMDEDYRIKAIFTQINGVPILLDAFTHEVCWLDDKGFIHVDNEQYYEIEYNLYELTNNGEYNLVYSLLAADNGNRYLTQNGKTEQITFEKSLEIYYNDYCSYVEPFSPNEQTRNASDITYTPLTETTDNLINLAANHTWHKYSNLEKTSDKMFARSNTYITFKNVTDTQITMSINYEFVFNYADPNQDNSLLDDITESTLQITAHNEGEAFIFNENGIKGKVEFGYKHLWIIIEQSSDERFPIGNHCYQQYSSSGYIN